MIKRKGTAVLGHMYDNLLEGHLSRETRYDNNTQNALYSQPGSHQSDRMPVFFQLMGMPNSWQKIHTNVADKGIMLASMRKRKPSTYKNPP